MKEIIELIDKEIAELENLNKEIEKKENYYYKNKMESIRNILPKSYEISEKIRGLKKQKELYEECIKEKIDLKNKFFLMKNVYLQFWAKEDKITAYFYIDDDNWIYDNYISSHSGINEWITELINQEYNLLSGNSEYSYAFNTMTLKEILNYIEDEKKENKNKIELIKNLIEFTKKNGRFKRVRQKIEETVNFKFKQMRDLVNE